MNHSDVAGTAVAGALMPLTAVVQGNLLKSRFATSVYNSRGARTGHEEGQARRSFHAVPGTERQEVPLGELRMRHLRAERQLDQIRHLRQQIQLPSSALADPSFRCREKKETKRVSSALSSAADP